MKGKRYYRIEFSAMEIHLVHEALQYFVDQNKSTNENYNTNYEVAKIRNKIEFIMRRQ